MNDAAKSLRPGESPESDPPYPSRRYAWFVVAVLMMIYVNSFLDRQILGLLVDPIRGSMGISEGQMGLLMGPAFAIFYIIAGIPLGRLADVMSRRWLVLIGQILWSVMSVGCGLMRTYTQFFMLRVGLGVGEASLSPSAYSMITDLFPKNKLARALSVYGLGIYIGSGLARFFGGFAVQYAETHEAFHVPILDRDIFSWQVVFFFIAAPTIPLSIVLLMTREPFRRGVRTIRTAAGRAVARSVPLGEVFAYLWLNRTTMLCYSFGFALLSFSGYGVSAWMPSHFIRNLGWEASRTGMTLGVVAITAGPIGVIGGGWISDVMKARGVRHARILLGLISCVSWFPFGIAYPLMNNPWMAIGFYALAVVIAAMPWGAGPAGIQEIMPNKMRGQASAIYLFIINLMVLGFGPYILSLFTQYVFRSDSGVRWSLLCVPVGAHLISVVLLLAAIRPYHRSLERLESRES